MFNGSVIKETGVNDEGKYDFFHFNRPFPETTKSQKDWPRIISMFLLVFCGWLTLTLELIGLFID